VHHTRRSLLGPIPPFGLPAATAAPVPTRSASDESGRRTQSRRCSIHCRVRGANSGEDPRSRRRGGEEHTQQSEGEAQPGAQGKPPHRRDVHADGVAGSGRGAVERPVSGGHEQFQPPRVVGLFHQAPKHVAGSRRNRGDRHVVLGGAHFHRAPRKRASEPARLADLPFGGLTSDHYAAAATSAATTLSRARRCHGIVGEVRGGGYVAGVGRPA
jgi:hypothetical protein